MGVEMKHAIVRSAVAAVMLAATGASAGQGNINSVQEHGRVDEGPPLSLPAAIAEARANNPELVALRQQVDVARLRPVQEKFLQPPMLEAQIWQWPLNTLNPLNTNMYMFMATQDVPGRGKRSLREAAAEKDVALAAVDVDVRARQILDLVKQAYADLFVARKAIDIHLASVDLLRQLADVSEAKYATGRISQHDVLKSIVELSKLHDDVIGFEQQAETTRIRLNVLLNRPPAAPIGALTDPVERVLVTSVADLQRVAAERQPDVQKAHVRVEQAQAQLAVIRSEIKPDFTVQGGYMLMPHQTDAWMGRVGITWPRAPWARGRTDARIAEATAAIDAANGGERAIASAVGLAVADAYVRVKAAERRAALLRTTILPQSEQTLEVSRIAYQADRVDFLTLIEGERTLLDARLEYFRAVSEHERALADLERAMGADLSATDVGPVNRSEVK